MRRPSNDGWRRWIAILPVDIEGVCYWLECPPYERRVYRYMASGDTLYEYRKAVNTDVPAAADG